MPQVSVYITTRNRPALLCRAVQSVLIQDYKDFELLIIDDCSDNRVVNQWGDERVTIINNTSNIGAPRSRNLAIKAARGKYITGLDDDDVFLPSRLSSFMNAWRELQPLLAILPVSGLFDSCFILTSAGLSPVIRFTDLISRYADLSRRNNIGCQVFVPASHFQSLGGFDPQMPAWQDWEFWLRISQKYGCFLNINSASMVVDESHGQARITTSHEKTIRTANQVFARKAGIRNPDILAEIRLSTLAYPSVRPRLNDVLLLLRARRYRQAFRLVRRL